MRIFDLKQKLNSMKTENGHKIYQTAIQCEGQSWGNNYVAFGCAEEVNAIIKKALGREIGGDVSTTRMYEALRNNPLRFLEVEAPIEGDIVISPTGYGTTGKVLNGHVGIYVGNQDIMSNDSQTGKFEKNYTLFSWKKRYGEEGGYPVKFYRVI